MVWFAHVCFEVSTQSATCAGEDGVDQMARILAFTGQQVERLIGLSERMLRYWEKTGVYAASYIDERPRIPYRRVYTFRDVVSLRTLALLRKHHRIKLNDLRRSGAFLRETYPDRCDPWAE